MAMMIVGKYTYATGKLLASRTMKEMPRYSSTAHGAGKRRFGMDAI
jgi:hypothetical protein